MSLIVDVLNIQLVAYNTQQGLMVIIGNSMVRSITVGIQRCHRRMVEKLFQLLALAGCNNVGYVAISAAFLTLFNVAVFCVA